MKRVPRMALLPLMLTGAAAMLVLGASNAAAATSSTSASHTPQSSSRPHKHERVTCSPGSVQSGSQCRVVFTDIIKKHDHSGQKVCFSVSPANAGTVTTTSGSCTTTNGSGMAFGTFVSSGQVCGKVTIKATEPAESQPHHTTITVVCGGSAATNTSFLSGASIGSSGSPGGWLLGVLGALVILAGGLRTCRVLGAWRLGA